MPQSPNVTTTLNAISCIVCRRRKVKCDRILPSCSNCSKGDSPCIYPASLRASRRKLVNEQYLDEANREAVLLKRLKKLESMVAILGSQVEIPAAIAEPPLKAKGAVGVEVGDADADPRGISQPFGKLVIEDGHRRYISSSAWEHLSEEVECIKHFYSLDPAAEPDDIVALGRDGNAGETAFVSSISSDLHSLRPMISQVLYYWHIFADSIDPLLKIIHQPTVDQSINAIVSNQMRDVTDEMEVLLFAIYFAVVMSMSSEKVFSSFGQPKSLLATRYRRGFEKALAQADYLKSSHLMVVQALIIFLMFAKIDDQRYVWSMTAIVIRIAQFIGLHRDGAALGLTPFETEMRRRTWWWVWGLDLRTAEDFSTEPIILRSSFDTQLPLNIEDSDITPEDKNHPKARQIFTAMSNFLMRCELMSPTTTALYSTPLQEQPKLQELESAVEKCEQHIETTWLPRCDVEGDPRAWLSVLMAKIVILKMRIWIYKPRPGADIVRTQTIRDKLFTYTLEVLELENIGLAEQRIGKWSWWFRAVTQWGALAFVLTELCIRSNSPGVLRAWTVIDKRLELWDMNALENESLGQKKGSLWFSIKRLLVKANNTRAESTEIVESQNMLSAERVQDIQIRDFMDDEAMTWDLLDDYQLSLLDIDFTHANDWSVVPAGSAPNSAVSFTP